MGRVTFPRKCRGLKWDRRKHIKKRDVIPGYDTIFTTPNPSTSRNTDKEPASQHPLVTPDCEDFESYCRLTYSSG